MSQGELADAAGISRHHLSNIENGAGVSTTTLHRIADALGDPDLFMQAVISQVRAIHDAAGVESPSFKLSRQTIVARAVADSAFRSILIDTGVVPVRQHVIRAAYRDGQPLEILTNEHADLPAFVAPSKDSIIIRLADDSLRGLGALNGGLLIAERLHGPASTTTAPVLVEVLTGGVNLSEALTAELPTGRVFACHLMTGPRVTDGETQSLLRRGSHVVNLNELEGPFHAPFAITAIFQQTAGGIHVER